MKTTRQREKKQIQIPEHRIPKVLVGIVTYSGKDYIWDKFINNIQNLTYPRKDIIIVDNSKERDYFNLLKKRLRDTDIILKHSSRGKTSRESQANSLNIIRDYMLNRDYEYLMLIESDLIPPVDIIERLIQHNVDCVGCMYNIGYVESPDQPPRPCLFQVIAEGYFSRTINLYPEEGFGYFGNGLRQVHGCGFGSTLIHRNLIEKFKFWYIIDTPAKHSDVLWYMDLHNEGYRAFVDTDFIIPHYNSNWNDVKDM